MIETPARVVRVDGEIAWVCPDAPSSCGACGGKGCGSSVFVRLLHPLQPEYAVVNPIAAAAGETVVVGIEEGSLLRAATLAYLVPLVFLLVGAVLGSRFGDLYAAGGALAGMVVAVFWLRGRRAAPSPAILRRGTVSCSTRQSPSR